MGIWPLYILAGVKVSLGADNESSCDWKPKEVRNNGLRSMYFFQGHTVNELPTMANLLQFLQLPKGTSMNKNLTPKPYVRHSDLHFSQSLFIIIQSPKLTSKINSLQTFQMQAW